LFLAHLTRRRALGSRSRMFPRGWSAPCALPIPTFRSCLSGWPQR